jgi:hypothetical protein
MAFTLSPLYGQAGLYTAQQDRLNLQAMTVTGGVRKLTNVSGGAQTGDLAVTTTGAGNASVSIASGLVVVPWTAASNQGHYLAYNDASTVLGTFAACPTNTRIDLVVVTVTDTGSASPSVAFAITQGTAAASPTAPATPANSIVLASILIPTGFTTGSTISAGSITDLRTKAFLPDLSSNSTVNAAGTTLSNVASPTSGNTVYSDIGDHLVTYDGSLWSAVPATSGHRNALINGAFNVSQRNIDSAATVTAGAALSYTIDRWYSYCTGANISAQRIAGTASDLYFYQLTGAASNTAVGFGQRIENVNGYQLAGQQATLSVKLRSSSLTSVTWTAYYANTANTFGTLASPTRTQIATGTFTITSSMARYQTTFAVPAAATTGIEIVFTGGALLASQTLVFGAVQFELGSIATPVEKRHQTVEMALCQRYYEKSYQTRYPAGTPVTDGLVEFYGTSNATGSIGGRITFNTMKRDYNYTTTLWSVSGVSGSWSYIRSGVSATNVTMSIGVTLQTEQGFTTYSSSIGANWTNATIGGHWVVDNEL